MDYSQIIKIIRENPGIDPYKLLLKGDKQSVDIKVAASTLLVRERLKNKVPEWYENPGLIFINTLSGEQASSQATAQYKASLITDNEIIADLTGGLGVDSWYFSKKAERVYYFERAKELCGVAEYNFGVLGAKNIEVRNEEIDRDNLDGILASDVTTIYIDPSRRDEKTSSRTYALQEYHPDILTIKDIILDKGNRLMVKVSPMLDIKAVLKLLPETKELHVVSVDNEVKELLFILDSSEKMVLEEIPIYLVNLKRDREQLLHFNFALEQAAVTTFFDLPSWSKNKELYLYEPNSSTLKGGAFKYIGEKFSLQKLSLHSHLYISEGNIEEFPGRVFRITEILPYNHNTIKSFHTTYPRTNISTRDFPLTPEQLAKKLKTNDGGSVYTFATTIGKEKVLVVGVK